MRNPDKNVRKSTAVRLLCQLSMAATLLTATIAQAQKPTILTFLHFNDTYAYAPNAKGIGGFGPFKTLLKREMAKAKGPTLLTFGGDAIAPTGLGTITKGAHMIEFLNELGLKVAVAGNHEFDFGPEVFQTRVKESKFPWLAANLVQKSDGKVCCGVQSNLVVTMGDIKVGIFGLIAEETEIFAIIGGNNTVKPYKAVAEQQIQALRAQGAEFIVALTHIDFPDDIVLASMPGINLILGGHEHVSYAYYGNDVNDVLVLKVGQDAQMLGVVEIPVERSKTGLVIKAPAWKAVPVQDLPSDPQLVPLVKKYAAMEEEKRKTIIGKTNVALNALEALKRSKEMPIGQLVSDAMRQETSADIALFHSFNFRNMKREPGESLSHMDILDALPYGNTVVVLELTGEQLLPVLEHGVSGIGSKNPRDAARFLHVSGIKFTYDPALPARAAGCPSPSEGKRVSSVIIGNAPLEPARKYRVAVVNFMSEGGNNWCMLPKVPRSATQTNKPLTDIVVNYVKQIKEVNQQPARITVIGGK